MELGGYADCSAESDDSALLLTHHDSNHGMVERDATVSAI
jgi:hypothetical protein